MRLKPAGERPPYTAMLIGAAMLAAYVVNSLPVVPAPAAEILRDGPSPAAPYRKPELDDLLLGRACIPLRYLLENRRIEPIHSYSRPIACDKGVSDATSR